MRVLANTPIFWRGQNRLLVEWTDRGGPRARSEFAAHGLALVAKSGSKGTERMHERSVCMRRARFSRRRESSLSKTAYDRARRSSTNFHMGRFTVTGRSSQ